MGQLASGERPGALSMKRSMLTCLSVCLIVLTSQFVGGQTDRVWRRERGTRALKAGQHRRQEGSALVAVMVSYTAFVTGR